MKLLKKYDHQSIVHRCFIRIKILLMPLYSVHHGQHTLCTKCIIHLHFAQIQVCMCMRRILCAPYNVVYSPKCMCGCTLEKPGENSRWSLFQNPCFFGILRKRVKTGYETPKPPETGPFMVTSRPLKRRRLPRRPRQPNSTKLPKTTKSRLHNSNNNNNNNNKSRFSLKQPNQKWTPKLIPHRAAGTNFEVNSVPC